MNYFQKITLIGNDVDTGVEGDQTPLASALPAGGFEIDFYVSAINFRPEFEIETTDFVGGLRYSTRTARIVCDLLPAESDTTYDYPAAKTTVETFYHVPTLNLKYYWLKFNDATAVYNLPPNMVTTAGATQEAWACNLEEFEISPNPSNGSYTITGKLTAITQE